MSRPGIWQDGGLVSRVLRRCPWLAPVVVPATIIAAGLLVIFGIVLFASAHESRVYNELTGANTTTWDAVWVELRVIAYTDVEKP